MTKLFDIPAHILLSKLTKKCISEPIVTSYKEKHDGQKLAF